MKMAAMNRVGPCRMGRACTRCLKDAATAACLTAIAIMAGCATRVPLVLRNSVGPGPSSPGDLVVYSATYAPTVEEGEYPVHTNYTIATPDDKVIQHVSNRAGPFQAYPATVALPSGEYHVRAQYDRGGFVVVPVVIVSGKTTIVNLNGGEPDTAKEVVRLPDGRVVGWRATSE
jgi:hypothetical protein